MKIKMQGWTLGVKLVVGGLVMVAVPLLVAGVIAATKSSAALEEAARTQVVDTARHAASEVKSILTEEMKIATNLSLERGIIQTAVNVAKNGTGKAAADVEALDRRLAAMMARGGNDYETIFLTDAAGTIYADGSGGGYKGIQVADRTYFKDAKAGKVNVGDVIKSKKTGLAVVTLCAPVVSGSQEFLGALVVVVKLDFVASKVATIKFGRTGYAFMLDKTGTMIAHPRKDLVFALNVKQQEGLKGVAANMLALKTGSDIYVFQGVKKVSGYAPVEMTGWCVGVTQDIDEFLAPAHSIRNYIVVTGVLFLILTAVAVLLFSRSVSSPIRRIARHLSDSSEQVASASSQVSSSSQHLAEGAAEQASSLEETASSMEEMSSMTRQNAGNAQQAKVMMAEARTIVADVDQHMTSLSKAMTDVARSSEETAKIIKTIDEIAFQTNLLALNAAVEAARAGEAGAGFAVVADEVRNLALRASDAAKNTSGLIEHTMDDVRNGTHLTTVTQEAFKRNVEIAMKIGSLVDEIAAASDEQARGIEQVSKAVQEMDKVTQQTAANAEESAAASEEMSAQAQQMKSYSAELGLIVGGNGNGHGPAESVSGLDRVQQKALSMVDYGRRKVFKEIPFRSEVRPQ